MPIINRIGRSSGSSGGTGISLAVAAYSSLPSSGGENEIAIISSTAVTSYKVQSDAPTSPSAGMVWIDIGEGSSTPIQLDNIIISPIRAYQYISSAWQPLDGYVRKSSSWVQFSKAMLEIFTNGTINTSVAGNFVYNASGSSSLSGTQLKVRTTASNAEGFAGTSSKIDVSSYKMLCVQVTCGSVNTSCSYGLRSAHVPSDGSAGWFGTYVASKSLSMTAGTQYTDSLDIELFNDSYYIVVSTTATGQSTYVDKIWLE